jgi:hypothetical protein
MPYAAGVIAPSPPISAITESWDLICSIASRRRSASNAPMKWDISTHTVGMTTPSAAALRSSGSRSRKAKPPRPRSSMAW